MGTTGVAPRRPGSARRVILRLFFAVGLGSIALDLLSKTIAVESLEGREPVELLGGFIYLDLIRNGGAAWGMGSEYTWVLSIVAICVSVGIAIFVWRVKSAPWAVAFGLIFGGALGNIVDRVFRAPAAFHGHVVDFISPFEPGGQAYPVFNLADSSLVIGVCLVVLLELTGRRMDGTRYSKEAEEAAKAGAAEKGATAESAAKPAKPLGADEAAKAEKPAKAEKAAKPAKPQQAGEPEIAPTPQDGHEPATPMTTPTKDPAGD